MLVKWIFNPPDQTLSIIKQSVEVLTDDAHIVGIDLGVCWKLFISYHIKDICIEKDAKILWFEPNPMNLIKISSITKNNKNIT